MNLLPLPGELIDVHSHHREALKGVFRLYNFFAAEAQEGEIFQAGSIGLHPWHIENTVDPDKLLEKIRKLAKLPSFLAIGEAGYDRLIRVSPEKQTYVFENQVQISNELSKPMIIHCVKAFDLLLESRTRLKAGNPWIIHGFTGNLQLAKDLVRHGCYISLSQRLMRKPDRASELIPALPGNNIFIESDDDPADLRDLYARVAALRNVCIEEMSDTIRSNFLQVFNPR